MPYSLIVCRALLLGVFLVALASKVRGHNQFVASIVALRLMPRAVSTAAAVGVTVLEAVVVVLLALPWTVAAGFVVAAALLVAFTAGISVAVSRGNSGP